MLHNCRMLFFFRYNEKPYINNTANPFIISVIFPTKSLFFTQKQEQQRLEEKAVYLIAPID